MNKQSIPLFVGVISSIIIILLINDFTVVDDCLNHSGSFNYKTGQCELANGEIHKASFTNYLVAMYFVVGIALAFVISKIVRKLFKLNT
ncbi:hypothetical protein HII17_10495 [Thalassotalea sp. M1531]|uniref:Uncharacterized protein n=1 Tax=Thalassotalea algicola TaxID=2716224 RepID=A0A7Y0LE47_9GAMM|nr:hypothetical protein [Thalassotalea algicola]NMP31996.1 hypothetical protein [Thalassotalea algicola]